MRLILISAVVLAGCSEKTANDGRICIPPPAYTAREDFIACVHREAYQLAGAPGSSKAVADAVVAGCVPDIQRFADEKKGQDADAFYSDAYNSAQDFALYYVTQARAGQCDVPARKKSEKE